MKSSTLISLALIIFLIGIRSFGAVTHAEGSKYAATGKNVAALKNMPIKVYLPTELPTDYVLFDYALEDQLKTIDSGTPNYSVMFLMDKSHWFKIESADTVGDVDWENAKTTEWKSDQFGKFSIQWTKQVDSTDSIKTPHVITSWLEKSDANRPKAQPSLYRLYHLVGRGLSADEVAAIVKSLKPQN